LFKSSLTEFTALKENNNGLNSRESRSSRSVDQNETKFRAKRQEEKNNRGTGANKISEVEFKEDPNLGTPSQALEKEIIQG